MLDARHGVGVGRAQVGLDAQVGDDEQAMAHVVEDDQVVGHHQRHVGHVQVGAGGGGQPLHEAHQVVAKVADDAAVEARQPSDGRRLARRHQLLHDLQRIALALLQHGAACRADRHLVAAGSDRHRRVHADETVAAKLFALLHRFEQEARPAPVAAPLPAQLEIDRDRRLQVGGQLAVDRDDVALLRQVAHFVE